MEMDKIEQVNVGGIIYTTRLNTLCVKDSYFEIMYSGRIKSAETINDAVFIDRDGTLFAHVLNYLRNLEEWMPPQDPKLILDLINEAKFYCLSGMLEKIKQSIPEKYRSLEVSFKLDIAINGAIAPTGVYLSLLNKEFTHALKGDFATLPIVDEYLKLYNFTNPKSGIAPALVDKFKDQYILTHLYETPTLMKMIFTPRYNDSIYDIIRKKFA